MPSHKKTQTPTHSKKLITLASIGIFSLLSIIATIFIYLSYNNTPTFTPAKTATVEHQLDNVPNNLKIGIIVSYTENNAEGRGWDLNGEGANVAKWRLHQGGTQIETHVVSDQGTENGAKEAITELKNQQVSAILAFTSGPHTQALAEAAKEANLPLVMPYAQTPETPVENTWYGQPSTKQKAQATQTLLDKHQCSETLTDSELQPLLNNPQQQTPVVNNTEPPTPSEKTQNPELTNLLNKLNTSNQPCLLIQNPQTPTHTLLTQLSQHNLTPTIIINQPATNAYWTQTITESNIPPTNLHTIGTPTSQLGQPNLNPTSKLNYAGFIEATQQMAADPQQTSFRNNINFAGSGNYADLLSYDSFIAITKAAANAKTTSPTDLAKALQTLQIPEDETLLGAPLNFTQPNYAPATNLTLIENNNRLDWVENNKFKK